MKFDSQVTISLSHAKGTKLRASAENKEQGEAVGQKIISFLPTPPPSPRYLLTPSHLTQLFCSLQARSFAYSLGRSLNN